MKSQLKNELKMIIKNEKMLTFTSYQKCKLKWEFFTLQINNEEKY